MKNDRKLKTENNLYNETYDDGNFYVKSMRQVTGFHLILFYNDRLSTFSKKVFGIDKAAIYTGT